MPGEAEPRVWAYRAAIGEWKRWTVVRAEGDHRHFNDADPGTLERLAPLWDELQALQPAVAPLLGDGLAAERALLPGEREALSRYLALIGVRNTKGSADLSIEEARIGVASLDGALQEMGWVLWVASDPDYFIGSSLPLLAALPTGVSSSAPAFHVIAP